MEHEPAILCEEKTEVPIKPVRDGRFAARYLHVVDKSILAKRDSYTMEWVDPQPWDEVLNISNHDGSLTAMLAPRVKRVTAVEASVPAIRRARLSVRRLGYPNVSFQVAGFLDFDCNPGSATKVIVRDAMHPLSEMQRRAAVDRVYRALAPGGVAVFQDIIFPFSPLAAPDRLMETLKSAADELGADVAAEIEGILRRYRPMVFGSVSAMLNEAGLPVSSSGVKYGLYTTILCKKE